MRLIFTIVNALFILTACGSYNQEESFKALPFPDVTVPKMMSGQKDIAEYMAVNFWNAITDVQRKYPSDSLLVSGVKKSDVEQKFANWLALLDMVEFSTAEKAVARLYDRAVAAERKDSASNVFETFNELVQKYMYDPNSPVRNEDYYCVYAKRLASYEGFEEAVRGRYAYEAEMSGRNRVGTVAADFRFSDSSGKIGSLHSIEAPLTLLFFSNPGCEACMDIISVLNGEPRLSEMISKGRLAVLNIYIDEDINAWKEYMPIYPKEWHNGFDLDMAIRNDLIYNVRAIPSLYLLDAEKRVILKDAPENRVFEILLN